MGLQYILTAKQIDTTGLSVSLVEDVPFHADTDNPTGTTRLNMEGYLYATRVYNCVWNDYADFWDLAPGVIPEPGLCYADYGNGLELPKQAADPAVLGIYSDTYGYGMGERDNAIPIAVAGFVLAYVDESYPPGTLLTNSINGRLRKAVEADILYHTVLAKYIKPETKIIFNELISVNGRHWVKVL